MENSQSINELKKKLNELNIQKELFFAQKEDKKKAISANIKQVKELRDGYANQSSQLRQLVKQRDDHNKKVKEAITKIKLLELKKKELLKKHKIQFNPSRISSQIGYLETKIETQALDFEKEKELMKKINALKKTNAQVLEISNLFQEQRVVQSQINENRHNADSAHKKIRELQKINKQTRKEFVKKSREIMQLKKEQNQAYQKFTELKKQYIELFNLIRNNQIRNKKAIQHIKNQILEKKHKQLEQKIKNRQKITNEDLLVFQSR